MNSGAAAPNEGQEGELSLSFLKKYINFARSRCGPRLSAEAAEKLKNKYVMMRSSTRDQDEQEMLNRIERQLKKRFAIGCQVSEHAILQDFARQKYPNHAVTKVLQFMIRRGELQHRIQRKMLYRIK